MFSRSTNHPHDAASLSCLLNLAFGEAFIILANSWYPRFAIGKVSIIYVDESCIRVVLEIKNMKAFLSRLEFNHPCWR